MYRVRGFDTANPAAEYQRLSNADDVMFSAIDGGYYRDQFYPNAQEQRWHERRDDWAYIVDTGEGTPIAAYCLVLPIEEIFYQRALTDPDFDLELQFDRKYALTKRAETDKVLASEQVFFWILAFVWDPSQPKLRQLLITYLERRFFGVTIGGVVGVAAPFYNTTMLLEAGMQAGREFIRADGRNARVYYSEPRGEMDPNESPSDNDDFGAIPFFDMVFQTTELTRHRRHHFGIGLTGEEKHVARFLYSWIPPDPPQPGGLENVFMSQESYAGMLADGRDRRVVEKIVSAIEAKVKSVGFPIHQKKTHQSLIAFFTLYPGELD